MENKNSGCDGHAAGERHDHPENGCGCASHAPVAEHHEHCAGCGCGSEMKSERHEHHDHGCGCGCERHAPEGTHHGHDHHEHDHHEHHHAGGHAPNYENGLSIAENNVLMALLERKALPVAQFSLTSSKSSHAYAVALEPVYIADPGDSMEQIKEYGALFDAMEDKDLIALKYGVPLEGYAYNEYRESAAYRHFVETANEARERGFTFDTPALELGSITLTGRGHEVIDRMLE